MSSVALSPSFLSHLSASSTRPNLAWPPAVRLGPALGVVVVHLLAVAALWVGGRTLHRVLSPAPVQVALLHETPATAAAPAHVARPSPSLPRPELPSVALPEIQVATAEARTAPAAARTAAAQPNPALPDTLTAPPPNAAAVRSPKAVSASALRYRIEPAVEVPRLSRRAGESGRVLLRVVFDTQGVPRDIQVQQSAGFPRLDAQALDAMRAARIHPYLEDGHPVDVVATAAIDYELE